MTITISKKVLILIAALILVIGGVVGGTVAWLVDSTGPVTNTFTVGDIDIDLTENTGNSYKIVPGVDIEKDPTVTVSANSEKCYVFVKVEEKNWPAVADSNNAKKVNYAIATGWTELTGITLPENTTVYYREVNNSTSAQEFPILLNNKITVSDTLTKAEANAIATEPTLTFTAYAVQYEGMTDAANAWAKVAN